MREQSHSANTENIVNHDVNMVGKLQEFNELKQIILYTHVLQNSANNKNVEKYDSVISENLTTPTGVQNKKGYKTNNKRKERRKKMAKKRIETQRKNNEKFIATAKSAFFLKGSNLSRHRWQMRITLDENSC